MGAACLEVCAAGLPVVPTFQERRQCIADISSFMRLLCFSSTFKAISPIVSEGTGYTPFSRGLFLFFAARLQQLNLEAGGREWAPVQLG